MRNNKTSFTWHYFILKNISEEINQNTDISYGAEYRDTWKWLFKGCAFSDFLDSLIKTFWFLKVSNVLQMISRLAIER